MYPAGSYLSSRKVLTAPAAPPPLKWRSDIYPCFLSGSVQLFDFTLLFFITLLISSLWPGHWWGIFQLCCCSLFSATVHTLVLSLKLSDQVRGGTAPARGRGTAQYALRDWTEWLTFLRHPPWLWLVVMIQEWWILANQITATGWSHRQLTCIWFYCHLIMKILANMTKK